jgi:hypothetical protein
LAIALRAAFPEACLRQEQQADRAEEQELQCVPEAQGGLCAT